MNVTAEVNGEAVSRCPDLLGGKFQMNHKISRLLYQSDVVSDDTSSHDDFDTNL